MKNGKGTMAPPKRGSGVKAVTGSSSTVSTGSAKGKKPKGWRS